MGRRKDKGGGRNRGNRRRNEKDRRDSPDGKKGGKGPADVRQAAGRRGQVDGIALAKGNLLGGLADIEVVADTFTEVRGREERVYQRKITQMIQTSASDGELMIDSIRIPRNAREIDVLVNELMKHIIGEGRELQPFPRKIEFNRNIESGLRQTIEERILENARIIYQRGIGGNRPPADPPIGKSGLKLGLESPKVRALANAQSFNEERAATERYSRNIEKLITEAKAKAIIYVHGKNAMGQGDTAFIVRTVKLLRNLGLNAVGVQAGAGGSEPKASEPEESKGAGEESSSSGGKVQGIFEGGNSFKGVIEFVNPEKMMRDIKASDFVIEGPLATPISAGGGGREIRFHEYNFERLVEREISKAGSSAEKNAIRQKYEKVRKLRLYEYGSLGLKAGELQRGDEGTPVYKSNVAHLGTRQGHAFMGMGAGEIGAFYNSRSAEAVIDLDAVLEEYRDHPIGKQILAARERNPQAPIFLGYANQTAVTQSWVKAVDGVIPGAIIIGVIGEKRDEMPSQIRSSRNTILMTKGIPSPLMNALRSAAEPFTLSTGNFSLSEAIETGQFSIYEALRFNGSVDNSYRWQILNALDQLSLDLELVD